MTDQNDRDDTHGDTEATPPTAFPYQQQAPPQPGRPEQPYGQPEQPYGQSAQPHGQPAQPYGQQPGGYGPPPQQFAFAAAATPPPRSPEQAARRRRLLFGLIGGGALLLVLIVAAVVTFVTMSASHRPEAAVRDYLGAVQSGQIERALQLDGTEVTDADVLLTDDAYAAAADQVDGFRLGGAATSGDESRVTALVHQSDGSTYEQEFTLAKEGTDLLIFDRWALRPVDLGSLVVQVGAPTSAEIAVDGLPVPRGDDGGVTLRAFPGTYDAALADDDEWFTASSTAGRVSGPGSAGRPAVVTASLTPAGTEAANAAVDAWVSACIASTDIAPSGCSFGLIDTEAGAYTLSNQSWTLAAAPQYTVGDWQGDGWSVSTTVAGSATFAADAVDGSGNRGTYGSLSPVPVRVGGVIADISADGATFTSSMAMPLT